jgi:hypothetical protein
LKVETESDSEGLSTLLHVMRYWVSNRECRGNLTLQ